jgi:hypothetical protein
MQLFKKKIFEKKIIYISNFHNRKIDFHNRKKN